MAGEFSKAIVEREAAKRRRLNDAAPDLLAALKRAADLLARYPKHDAAWKQARAAIAKAGEQ